VPTIQGRQDPVARRRAKKTSESEDIRATLLRAAEACFDRYGIAKTTMEDVAKAAGVSRWTIYRCFDDRDGLILAVLLPRGQRITDRAHRRLRRYKSFPELLVEAETFLITESLDDEIVRLLLDPAYFELTNRLIDSSDALVDNATRFWEPLIVEAQERGEVAADLDRRAACRWLMLVGVALAGRFYRESGSIEEIRSMIRRFVVPAFTTPAQA
jgi:AcrR family transcriptional regulator